MFGRRFCLIRRKNFLMIVALRYFWCMKVNCIKCGFELEWSGNNFYRRSDQNHQLRQPCKKCVLDRKRDRGNVWVKEKRSTDEAFKKRQKDATKRWLKRNPEKAKAISKRTRLKHIEKRNEYVRNWHRTQVKDVTDFYVKGVLKKDYGFTKDQMTPEIVAVKKEVIKINRLIKSKNQ